MKQTKTFENINNIAFAVLFGFLGLTTLMGALFFNTTHHFFSAGACALVVWRFCAEVRKSTQKTN